MAEEVSFNTVNAKVGDDDDMVTLSLKVLVTNINCVYPLALTGFVCDLFEVCYIPTFAAVSSRLAC